MAVILRDKIGKESFWLLVEGTSMELPVTVIRGKRRGKTALVTAGVHSCEYVGVEAAMVLARTLTPEEICGTVILIHSCNYSGFLTHSNDLVPEDWKNLNASFPGRADGTTTERLANFYAGNF